MEMTPTIMDSRYYRIMDTFVVLVYMYNDNFILLTLNEADSMYFSYNLVNM